MVNIIGIVNYNENSFSDGGQHSNDGDVIAEVENLFKSGADIVDIGVSSTSYGVPKISQCEEFKKIRPLIDQLKYKNISIDSYHYETLKYAVHNGVKFINDVNGGKDLRTLQLVSEYPDVHYICMFSLTLPANKKIRVKSINQIYDWIDCKIQECKRFGIKTNRIIIDPGIGFVTDSKQSIELLINVKELKKFGVKICVGHSRKSFLNLISSSLSNKRDIETLAISLYLAFYDIDYIRVHNVKIHKRALRAFNTLLHKSF